MTAINKPEQAALEGVDHETVAPHMIARINAVVVKLVFPFVAQQDVRFYLNGINIRPLDDGSVMAVATDGHRYVVVRDPSGYAEQEIIVAVNKDLLKHAGNTKHTLDVMSNGTASISDQVASPLFILPGNSLIDAAYPRIEKVASLNGYKEGISGSINPRYLADALTIAKSFGNSIRFFNRDNDSALTFLLGGVGDLECFGGIMKRRDDVAQLPTWLPIPTEAESLDDV